jgi:hydrogenase-4 component F
MLLVAIVLVPVLGSLGAYLDRAPARRAWWLIACAALHLAGVALVWRAGAPPAPSRWLTFDPLGGLVLALVSVVFMAVALYSRGYLRHEDPRGGRAYVSCLLGFLAAASVVTMTHQFGMLWVGMEATTLVTAPLIYDPHDRRSLEAVWKYLLVCSVGIALALLGTFFLAMAQIAGGTAGRPLVLDDLIAAGATLHPAWLRAAFVFLLVGFGTKMGLVPMHTWLPDAHGEAPSPVSALLSGALLNLAFLAILRGFQVVRAAGAADFAQPLLIGFGVLSLAVAAAFLVHQADYKRMLAYSSIEHMGILAIGVGIAGAASYGALLHMIGASLAKALLFLAAGNVLAAYGSKRTRDVTGLLRTRPVTGVLLIAGLFAITGSPPFAPFLSELVLLTGAFREHHPWVAISMLGLQALIFIAMGAAVLGMVLGEPATEAVRPVREDPWLVAPPLALLALVAFLGLHLPGALRQALAAGASALGGHAP